MHFDILIQIFGDLILMRAKLLIILSQKAAEAQRNQENLSKISLSRAKKKRYALDISKRIPLCIYMGQAIPTLLFSAKH